MDKYKKVIVLLFVVASFNVAAIHLQSREVMKDDIVQVDVYFESLCPDSKHFITKSFKSAVNTKDLQKISVFQLYPYGFTQKQRNGTSWNFTCQHGQKQCLGNILQTCAIRLNPQKNHNVLQFIICLEENTTDLQNQGKRCASEFDISWDGISNCANSQMGIDYYVEMGQATDLLPSFTEVPYVKVNGYHSHTEEISVQLNLVDYICAAYQGSQQIDACR